ncbi:putative transporter SVOPL [Babylonia areolata]|uniref:putative transporter SVOPL n=1 Tax=Babylonia areolata TaxID=304850 RepID=UPI003FD32526
MMLLSVLSPVVRCEWFLSEWQVALITTVVFLGMGISSPLIGLIGDRFGRKVALLMVTLCIGYFGLLATFSPSYGWMLLLRGLVGCGMGGSTQGSSLLAEYLPAKYRAKLMLTNQVFWATGVTLEILLASVVIPKLGWRWLMVFSSVPVIVAAIFLLCVPESARYLVAAGRMQEANKVLQTGAVLNKATLPPGHLVKASEQTQLGRPLDLFAREYRRSTLQLWVLWFGTAFAYYGMVLVSSQVLTVKSSAKQNLCKCAYLTSDDYNTMIFSTLGEFMCIPLNIILIDTLGRRLTGTTNLFMCAVFFCLIQLPVSRGALTFFMFAVRGFSSATFAWVYLYSLEMYPTSVRTFGMGTASMWARVGAMATPFVAQVLLTYSVATALWAYTAVCMVCSITAFCMPIETRGRAMPQFVEQYVEMEMETR